MPAPLSLIPGFRIAHLTAMQRLPFNAPDGGAVWEFRCDCGHPHIARARQVIRGSVVSCGHIRRSQAGLSKHPTYTTWRCMIARCYDPSHLRYADYGGRGISVYFDWLGEDGFKNFLAHVGLRPAGKTLDRLRVDGDYEPFNVCWATSKQQAKNRRKKCSK